MAKVPKQPRVILEHSTPAELEENVIDGMGSLMGDDILSSDYVGGVEEWPGVNPIDLPEPYKRPGQVPRVTEED